ncbi:DCC1-like thiol-disulfide oxidoreductase family protein [Lederbergia sp. NSJ-179]|uniref:thiol-disulfide oxidoreductase DCC family protein n=1 Tax=Lederbergia sp. NSJ-179 TaxID=2931402 RepID=UPI001FD60E60|nr:DCC1-like thiol-disulfide oxidoreductase family protein [Lederbergia sp. NSJ-179]MCJ7840451.1 DCC1-like thiol-disulfide oxidoreductase family protein [Lederbergia sp. NSJ-179]
MGAIILFDGECHFCNRSVQFTIKRDPAGYFQFSSLQGNYGKKLLADNQLNDDVDSMILIEDGKFYCKSTAALRICKHLKGLWPLAYLFIVIPTPIRNLVYDFIAKNRYKWFGKAESCMLPSPGIRKRFLT